MEHQTDITIAICDTLHQIYEDWGEFDGTMLL